MLTLVFSALFACSDNPKSDRPIDKPDDQNDIPSYFNQTLVLVETDNFEPVTESIEISFESVEPDGVIYHETQSMSFSASCNSMFGNYYLEEDDFVMTDLATTYIACEDEYMIEDEWLKDFFTSMPILSYENGQVIFEGDESTLVFEVAEAAPDSDLVDTQWSVNGYERDGIAVGIIFDVAPSFVLHSDQSFSLETGCNSAMGTFEQSGDEIVVNIDAITPSVCSDDLSQEGEDLAGPSLSLISEAVGLTLTASAE